MDNIMVIYGLSGHSDGVGANGILKIRIHICRYICPGKGRQDLRWWRWCCGWWLDASAVQWPRTRPALNGAQLYHFWPPLGSSFSAFWMAQIYSEEEFSMPLEVLVEGIPSIPPPSHKGHQSICWHVCRFLCKRCPLPFEIIYIRNILCISISFFGDFLFIMALQFLMRELQHNIKRREGRKGRFYTGRYFNRKDGQIWDFLSSVCWLWFFSCFFDRKYIALYFIEKTTLKIIFLFALLVRLFLFCITFE